jgi:hypothetical protein
MLLSEKIEAIVQEIELFIQYGVQEQEQQVAIHLLRRYRNDFMVLLLMKAFYTSLPDTHEEAITRIAFVEKKEEVFLLAVSTVRHGYLYLVNNQKALLFAEYGGEILEPDALVFFGFHDADTFFTKYPAIENLEEYEPVGAAGARFCPVCLVGLGEHHLLGCPVEVCPWCDGQLSRCGCRFEQMGVDALEDEKELEKLEQILGEKGRVPYALGQHPSYPSDADE